VWQNDQIVASKIRVVIAAIVLVAAFAVLLTVSPERDSAGAATGPANGVDIELTPDGSGYWVLDNYGRVFAFGSATYLGGSPTLATGESAVSLDPTPSGNGYWIFTSIGRVIAYGDAVHHGDVPEVLPGVTLQGPILDTAPTPSGNGYYMLGSDGGVFTFGDAAFWGSIQQFLNDNLNGIAATDWLNEPIVGIAPTDSGKGYWLVAADGGMFAFGDAEFHGSVPEVLPGVTLNQPVVSLVSQGAGYLLVAGDGGIFTFGSSNFLGSIPGLGTGGVGTDGAVAAVTVASDRSGYTMLGADGVIWPFGSLAEDLGDIAAADLTIPANPGDSRACADFANDSEAQAWFDAHRPFFGDVAGLDAGGDGLACNVASDDLPTSTTTSNPDGPDITGQPPTSNPNIPDVSTG